MIQSFDWRTIILAKQLDPKIETVALVWQFAGADCDNLDDECSLEAVMGDPSVKSPWTGGLDWCAFKDLGRLVAAARRTSSHRTGRYTIPPGNVVSDDFYAKEDRRCSTAHGRRPPESLQLRVVRTRSTTRDDPTRDRPRVDGIISDDPTFSSSSRSGTAWPEQPRPPAQGRAGLGPPWR
jgi:hypothetical protein